MGSKFLRFFSLVLWNSFWFLGSCYSEVLNLIFWKHEKWVLRLVERKATSEEKRFGIFPSASHTPQNQRWKTFIPPAKTKLNKRKFFCSQTEARKSRYDFAGWIYFFYNVIFLIRKAQHLNPIDIQWAILSQLLE